MRIRTSDNAEEGSWQQTLRGNNNKYKRLVISYRVIRLQRLRVSTSHVRAGPSMISVCFAWYMYGCTNINREATFKMSKKTDPDQVLFPCHFWNSRSRASVPATHSVSANIWKSQCRILSLNFILLFVDFIHPTFAFYRVYTMQNSSIYLPFCTGRSATN